MAFNTKVGRGSLSKSKKVGSGPEYLGSLKFDATVNPGDRIWLAAWVKTGDDGGKYFSIVVEKAAEQEQRQAAPPRQQYQQPQSGGGRNTLDDEIPFAAEFR